MSNKKCAAPSASDPKTQPSSSLPVGIDVVEPRRNWMNEFYCLNSPAPLLLLLSICSVVDGDGDVVEGDGDVEL